MILKNKIKKIIDAIKGTEIDEISISSFWGFQKIKMSKNKSGNFGPNLSTDTADNKINEVTVEPVSDVSEPNKEVIETQPEENNSSESIIDNLTIINAPLVGTFYESSKPGEPPFINIGDEIKKGQPLCIIEAMKIFNEIESEHDGVIVEILIEDGQPVEYGQGLFKIKEQ